LKVVEFTQAEVHLPGLRLDAVMDRIALARTIVVLVRIMVVLLGGWIEYFAKG